MDKKNVYLSLLFISILSIILCILFNADGLLGFAVFMISLYLLLGSIIKLCKISHKFKNYLANFVDLLFFIP